MTSTKRAFIIFVLHDHLQRNPEDTYKPSLNIFSQIYHKVNAGPSTAMFIVTE